MRLFIMLLLMISGVVTSKNNTELLAEATITQEKTLLEQNRLLTSDWLENSCMELSQELAFKKIKQCKFIDSKHINAYVLSNGHVYFTLAMMQQIKNKHQWASILAHENAHLELNHYKKTLEKYQNPGVFFPKSKLKKMLKKHEKQADEWSEHQLNKKGFDNEQIYFLMKRVENIDGDNKSSSHIRLSKRIKNNNTIEKIDKELIKYIDELVKTSQPQ